MIVGDAVGVLVRVTVGDGGVRVGVGVGANVVGGAVVGANVVGSLVGRDAVTLGVGLGDGESFVLLVRDAHRAPAPRPIAIAAITASTIGALDGFLSGSGGGSCAGGMAMVG